MDIRQDVGAHTFLQRIAVVRAGAAPRLRGEVTGGSSGGGYSSGEQGLQDGSPGGLGGSLLGSQLGSLLGGDKSGLGSDACSEALHKTFINHEKVWSRKIRCSNYLSSFINGTLRD